MSNTQMQLAPLWRGVVLYSAIALGCLTTTQAETVRAPLTVADSVQLRRIVGLLYANNPVAYSPDGKRFLAVTSRGDLERNGNWVTLMWGNTTSVEAASKLDGTTELFSISGRASPLRNLNDIRWLDDGKHVAFLWDDGVLPTQVVTLNLTTGSLSRLTEHETDVVRFDISGDARVLIYTAISNTSRSKAAKLRQQGFVVSTTDLHPLLDGYLDGRAPHNYGQIFVVTAQEPTPREIEVPARNTWFVPPEPRLSPDARMALFEAPPQSLSPQWTRYRAHSAPYKESFQSLLDRVWRFADDPGRVTQWWVAEIASAKARPIWNAPSELGQTRAVWSPDSVNVLLAPTYIPVEGADELSLHGQLAAVIEARTGAYSVLPTPAVSIESAIRRASFVAPNVIVLEFEPAVHAVQFERDAASWSIVPNAAINRRMEPKPAVQIQWQQDYRTPPVLVAVGSRSNVQRKIFELDSRLRSAFRLGRVDIVNWRDATGRGWSGRLYYPVEYTKRRKFPLVLQSHPLASPQGQFSVNGNEAITTAFAAQPLANQNMFVLQISEPDDGLGSDAGTPREREIMLDGYVSAVSHLQELGYVDPQRVGIVGFSRSGQYVTYALTRPDILSLQAAIVADNSDASYMQYLSTNMENRAEYDRTNGASPYGTGMQQWLQRAPGFNVDKIETPLRMEREDGGIASLVFSWEIYSSLRYMNKPVELYVIPDIDDATHVLEKPRQILASQEGTVDWMAFWLGNYEDPNPEKAVQYRRWRGLRALRSLRRENFPTP